MIRLGTIYGGWSIPSKNNLNKNSIVYSAGVGEDISFDLQLQSKYHCNLFLIDPTIKAKKHFNECINFFNDKSYTFTGNIQKDYYTNINSLHPNFDNIKYLDIGLWNKKDTLKFYKQTNKNYVSQSLINGMFGKEYDIVHVDSIKNIMMKHGHNKIDLLKLDIEGAEIKVLEQMLNDNIYPKYLCIEFDLFLKKKDFDKSTSKIIQKLENNGYKIVVNDKMNITFEYQKTQ